MSEVKKDLTVSMEKAQTLGSLIGILPCIVIYLIYYMIWKNNIFKGLEITKNDCVNLLIFLCMILVLYFFHEMLHCIGFMFSKDVNKKDVKIGMNLRTLTPYAHCSKAISLRLYRLAMFLPTFILGIIPLIIAFISGNITLMVYGLLMFGSGGGDILILFMLRNEKKGVSVRDHPSRVGCEIYEFIADVSC